MKKSLAIAAALVFVLCIGTSSASAETCQTFKMKAGSTAVDLDPGDFEALAEYFGLEKPLEWCWAQQVTGSIRGEWALCGSTQKKLYRFDPLGFGYGHELYGNPGMITTENGDVIFTMSFSLAIWNADYTSLFALGEITKFVGGTGAYEGISGWTSDKPAKNPPTLKLKVVGSMCTPD